MATRNYDAAVIRSRKKLSQQKKLDSRASPASGLGPYGDSSALLYDFQ